MIMNKIKHSPLCSSVLLHCTNAIVPGKMIELRAHLNFREFCGTCSCTKHDIAKQQNTFEQKTAELC